MRGNESAGGYLGRCVRSRLAEMCSVRRGADRSAQESVPTRIGQGIGAAIVAPTALSLLADTFAEGPARNRALGVYSAVSAGGGAIGLLLGGVITNYFSWRWILFVNVPVGLVLAFVGAGKRGICSLPRRTRRNNPNGC